MSLEDLEKFLPVVIINSNYVITSLNETGKAMLGDVVGRKCFQALYNLEKPCPEYNIKCPIVSKEEGVDTITLDFEVYLRSYGKLPVGGVYWESLINITNLTMIRSGIFDTLTELYNRRFLSGVFEKLMYLWHRHGETFSILFLDLDNMKRINDEYGHLSGDEALKKVGQCIKLHLRRSDIGVRYGGDEFLILLPKTDMDNAVKVAKRIRECIRSIPFVMSISATIAVSEVRKEDRMPEDLIERADKALYFAKNKKMGSIAVAKENDTFEIVE